MSEPDLKAALALTGRDAMLKLYRDWAESYDSAFAGTMEFRLPALVAGAFVAAGGIGSVLDVGAGTGLCGAELRKAGFQGPIDALDLSSDMLAKAAEKGVYRHFLQADVTQPLPIAEPYAGITCSGTFTAGHVGPEAFDPLLAALRPGGVMAVSINRRVWSKGGYDRALADLAAAGKIRDLQETDVQVYGQSAALLDPEHAEDRAAIVLFAKV